MHVGAVHIIWGASVKRLTLSLLVVETHPASFSVHADLDAMRFEYAGGLAALVGVEDLGRAMAGKCCVERLG